MFWVYSGAPDGPVDPPAEIASQVDMASGYPIALLRQFVPNPLEFLPHISNSYEIVWYIQRATLQVWNPSSSKPRYDTRFGRACYVESHLGGSFNFPAWESSIYPSCNCYDLAGVLQLACCLLRSNGGLELADSHWVFQSLNGFINEGPLFRWVSEGGDNLRCNTPFWAYPRK